MSRGTSDAAGTTEVDPVAVAEATQPAAAQADEPHALLAAVMPAVTAVVGGILAFEGLASVVIGHLRETHGRVSAFDFAHDTLSETIDRLADAAALAYLDGLDAAWAAEGGAGDGARADGATCVRAACVDAAAPALAALRSASAKASDEGAHLWIAFSRYAGDRGVGRESLERAHNARCLARFEAVPTAAAVVEWLRAEFAAACSHATDSLEAGD